MFKDLIKKLRKDSIFEGSFLLISGSVVLYACSYLYHFYTGRVLGPEDYGIIGALFSLLYIILVPFNAIQMGVTKFVAEFKAKNEYGKVKSLVKKAYKKLFIYGLVITLIFIFLSRFISDFLNIESNIPVMLLGLIIIPSLLLPVSRGVLQGSQLFRKLGINMSFEGLGRISFAVLLVTLGFGVNGAIFALVLAFTFAFIVILIQLRKFLRYKEKKIDSKKIYSYSWPVLFTTMAFFIIFSIDVILVKHFFDPIRAGFYTALSNLGKIVFFLNFPIIQVMFPIASEGRTLKMNKKELSNILYKSFFMIFIIGLSVILFYFIFPEFMISMLYGSEYLEISGLLGYIAVFIFLFSLSYLLAFYNLSLNRTKFVKWLLLSVVLEGILIVLYHASLLNVILSLIGLNSLVLLYLLIYTKYAKN